MESKSEKLKDGIYECLTIEDFIYLLKLYDVFGYNESGLDLFIRDHIKDGYLNGLTVCVYINKSVYTGWYGWDWKKSITDTSLNFYNGKVLSL